MGEWRTAGFAEHASKEAVLVCCGNARCFDGRGCETARWWTERMADTRYRLVAKLPAMADETRSKDDPDHDL